MNPEYERLPAKHQERFKQIQQMRDLCVISAAMYSHLWRGIGGLEPDVAREQALATLEKIRSLNRNQLRDVLVSHHDLFERFKETDFAHSVQLQIDDIKTSLMQHRSCNPDDLAQLRHNMVEFVFTELGPSLDENQVSRSVEAYLEIHLNGAYSYLNSEI